MFHGGSLYCRVLLAEVPKTYVWVVTEDVKSLSCLTPGVGQVRAYSKTTLHFGQQFSGL